MGISLALSGFFYKRLRDKLKRYIQRMSLAKRCKPVPRKTGLAIELDYQKGEQSLRSQ